MIGIRFERIDKWFNEVPSVSNRLLSQASVFALINLESYVNGLILQWNRTMTEEEAHTRIMTSGLLSSNRQLQEDMIRLRTTSSLDIHFYLICWDKVNKHFEKLAKSQRHPDIGIARRPVRKLLEQASKARDFFEHLENKNQQGHGVRMGGDDEVEFSYVDTDRKTGRDLPESKVELGKREVQMIIKAYETVVEGLRNTSLLARN